MQELIATHCEPALDADAARGRARRFLQTSREADGSLRGRFLLPAEDAETLLTALEPLARRHDRTADGTADGLADDRSAGQRRADALIELCEQVLRHGELPAHGGARPQLSYVLPADWAAARQAGAACGDCGPRCATHSPPGFAHTVTAARPGRPGQPGQHGCAVGAWTGPQTRARIETLLCDARLSRVLLDAAGQVRGLQSLTDSVTPAQRRALAARDLGCVARGCTRSHGNVRRPPPDPTCRRRPDHPGQHGLALPAAPRAVAPLHAPPAPPARPLAPRRRTRRPTTRAPGRPARAPA